MMDVETFILPLIESSSPTVHKSARNHQNRKTQDEKEGKTSALPWGPIMLPFLPPFLQVGCRGAQERGKGNSWILPVFSFYRGGVEGGQNRGTAVVHISERVDGRSLWWGECEPERVRGPSQLVRRGTAARI